MSPWCPSTFDIASTHGIIQQCGWVYRGLGLSRDIPPSRIWSVTHLKSGHSVRRLCGKQQEVFAIATEMAELTDWQFSSLDGYLNSDPELPHKIRELDDRHPAQIVKIERPRQNESHARQIAEMSSC